MTKMEVHIVKKPVARDTLDWLTQQACFAADIPAMELMGRTEFTSAQRTKLIVGRAIEFLIGNGLIEVTLPPNSEGLWMQIEPPYDETKIEPRKNNG